MKLLIGTNNQGKLREMKALLAGLDLEIVSPTQIGLSLEVEENGQTYQENAARKALAFAQHSSLLALADDSGLEVDALGGAPGVYSARFAPLPHPTDADRCAYLLQQLQGQPLPWIAHFHCTIAIATPQGELYYTEGNCPGEIIPVERGSDGFGYDPIFLLPELGQTMAELSLEQKNQLSHRARAVREALPILSAL